MKKIKRNGFLIAAGLMLAVMILATSIISGTLAKYRSTGTFNSTLTVATWSFDISKGKFPQEVVSETLTLANLSWTVKPTETNGSNSYDNTIAPGTWGYAAITVKNVGDVDAYVTVDGSGLALPTESENGEDFPSDRLTFAIMTDLPEDENDIKSIADGTLAFKDVMLVRKSNAITFYLVYKWEFGEISSTDTSDAEEDNALQGDSFDFGTFTITATQVEPKKALAYSQPMPKTAYRPTPKINEEVTTNE